MMRAAELLAHRFYVRQLDEIGVHLGGGVGAGRILRVDQIGSDAANLIQYVIAAGDRDGDHQNHRRVADHQAERGEKSPEFVGAQSLRLKRSASPKYISRAR